MKKNLFLASALVMGMMSSCSNDVENVTVPGADQNLQPVELSIATPSVIVSPETRGIGTVGDIADEAGNVWNSEELYVNMMCYYKDGAAAWEVSKWTKVDAGGGTKDIENFNNVKVTAPSVGNQGALVITPSAEGRYYPPTASKHQFFAYHIDDAIIGSDYTSPTADGNPEVVDDPVGKTRKVYFKIDGSQDLMMGEAVAKEAAGEYADVLFSAKSARGGVIPNLVMKHLLTRFTFNVNTDKDDNNLKVEKIIVKSKDRGSMCVAYATQPAQLLEFEDDVTGLELKEKAGAGKGKLQALTPVALTIAPKSVGEALMVAPGEESYDITIVASQTVGGGQSHTFSYDSKIKIGNGGALAGSSYKVNITLYGLQEIKIEAQLTGWNQADDEINLTPGEEF